MYRTPLIGVMLLPLALAFSVHPLAHRASPCAPVSCVMGTRALRSRAATTLMCAGGKDEGSSELEDTLRASLSAHMMRPAQFGTAEELLNENDAVWVLLFNPQQHDEGVYTLQGRADSRTYIVAFEQGDESERFAQMLQAEGFDLATPTEWSAVQVATFCERAGFEISLVPKGALLLPPATNVYDTEAFEQLDKHRAAEVEDTEALREEPQSIRDARALLERMWDGDANSA